VYVFNTGSSVLDPRVSSRIRSPAYHWPETTAAKLTTMVTSAAARATSAENTAACCSGSMRRAGRAGCDGAWAVP